MKIERHHPDMWPEVPYFRLIPENEEELKFTKEIAEKGWGLQRQSSTVGLLESQGVIVALDPHFLETIARQLG